MALGWGLDPVTPLCMALGWGLDPVTPPLSPCPPCPCPPSLEASLGCSVRGAGKRLGKGAGGRGAGGPPKDL